MIGQAIYGYAHRIFKVGVSLSHVNCAEHNLHVKPADARESGDIPQESFENYMF